MDSDDDNVFVRELQLESFDTTLKFIQKKVGDVSCVVWDAAIVLAKYLDYYNTKNHEFLHSKRVLELGAGLGCAGLTAASLGADVILTDLENVLPLLKKNVQVNEKSWKISGGRAAAKTLEWGKKMELDFEPELVLLADCVYYEESIDPLLETLENLLSCPETYAILSQESRDTPKQAVVWNKFFNLLNLKFNIEIIPETHQHPTFSSSDIYLMKIFKKKLDSK